MSTLSVSNITDGTDTVETGYVVNGSAKAWVNFNGTGTIAARDSLNVASLTDNGVGNFTVGLTNNMANANYSSVITGSAGSSSSVFVTQNINATSYVLLDQRQSNGANIDLPYMQLASYGDLA